MPLDTTLLDLYRAPTILEMRAFFKKHDWSAAKISDTKSRTNEEYTATSRIGRIMDAALFWIKLLLSKKARFGMLFASFILFQAFGQSLPLYRRPAGAALIIISCSASEYAL